MKKKYNKKTGHLISIVASIFAIASAVIAIGNIVIEKLNPNDIIQESKKTTEIVASNNSDVNVAENSSGNNIFGDNNSGNNIIGNDSNVSVVNNYAVSNDEEEQEEKVFFIGQLIGYHGGTVDNEDMYMFSGGDFIPLYEFELFNKTGIEININDIFVEVLSYKDFNEFIIENPRGGANINKIICWSCNISPEKAKYHVILNGTDENNMDDLSETEYVSIKASESGKFKLKILPDTPGLYEVKIIIEYASGENESIETENMKFIYDPEHCANYRLEWNGNISINHSYISDIHEYQR